MRSLAELNQTFGNPHRDPDGQEGKPQAPIAHAMLFHALGLLEMFRTNQGDRSREEAHDGFVASLNTAAWYHQIEPRDLLLTYVRDWLMPRMPHGRV